MSRDTWIRVQPCPLLTAFSCPAAWAQPLRAMLQALHLNTRCILHTLLVSSVRPLLPVRHTHATSLRAPLFEILTQRSVTRTKGLLHFLYLRIGRGCCTAEASNHSAPLHSGAAINKIEIWGNFQFRKPVSQVFANIYNIPCRPRLGFSGLSWLTAVGNWYTISIFRWENARIYKTHAAQSS